MSIGRLDDLIYLEEPATQNNGGAVTTIWTDISGNNPATPYFSDVITEKGSETFEAARKNANAVIRVKMIYREDVKTTWRVKWEEQYYYIDHIDRSDRRNGFLWVTAKATGAE